MYLSKLALVSKDAVNGNCINNESVLSIDPVVSPYAGALLVSIFKLKNPGMVITGELPFVTPSLFTVLFLSFLPLI
jgi:hypothetical protein